jgi:AraC-like DNA-binding protein
MLNDLDFGLKILSVHSFSWEKQYKYAYPRPFHALSIRLEGQADFTHDSNLYSVEKNQIVFVPKNYDYTLNSKTAERVIVIHFDTDTTYSEIETFSPNSPAIFISLFEQIERVFSSRAVGYKQKIYSLFYEILEQIQIQSKRSATLNSNVNKDFENSIDYLLKNFSSPDLTVSELAKIAAVSEVYYRKIFKQLYGIPPCKRLNELRLNKAQRLLKSGYYTVERVAYDCGFNDVKYFSTCYKKKFSHSPGKDISKLFKNIQTQ